VGLDGRMTVTCPLHPHRTRCACTIKDPLDLDSPAAIGLWQCGQGHRIVGGPTLHFNSGCDLCGGRLTRIAVGIHTPRTP
jgi:hypothetical protein